MFGINEESTQLGSPLKSSFRSASKLIVSDSALHVRFDDIELPRRSRSENSSPNGSPIEIPIRPWNKPFVDSKFESFPKLNDTEINSSDLMISVKPIEQSKPLNSGSSFISEKIFGISKETNIITGLKNLVRNHNELTKTREKIAQQYRSICKDFEKISNKRDFGLVSFENEEIIQMEIDKAIKKDKNINKLEELRSTHIAIYESFIESSKNQAETDMSNEINLINQEIDEKIKNEIEEAIRKIKEKNEQLRIERIDGIIWQISSNTKRQTSNTSKLHQKDIKKYQNKIEDVQRLIRIECTNRVNSKSLNELRDVREKLCVKQMELSDIYCIVQEFDLDFARQILAKINEIEFTTNIVNESIQKLKLIVPEIKSEKSEKDENDEFNEIEIEIKEIEKIDLSN